MKNRLLSFFLIVVATIIVLYFSLKDDYITIMNTIFSIDKKCLLIAFLLLFGYYFFRSYSMNKLVKEFNKNYTLKKALRLILETNFFHAVTPFATGGQPYEIYSLNKSNIKLSDAMCISVENFIVYQIALVLLGSVSIICNNIFGIIDSSFLKSLITLGFIINVLVIVILFSITFSKKTDKKIVDFFINLLNKLKIIKDVNKTKDKFHKYLQDFNNGSKRLFKNKKRFVFLIICQLISLVSLYLVPLALFYGIDIHNIKIYEDIIVMSYVMLIGSFVPIPGGTGGLEYGFVSFFSKFIVGAKVNATMLLWRFITYYFGMILGAIILNVKKEVKK